MVVSRYMGRGCTRGGQETRGMVVSHWGGKRSDSLLPGGCTQGGQEAMGVVISRRRGCAWRGQETRGVGRSRGNQVTKVVTAIITLWRMKVPAWTLLAVLL